MKTDLFQSCGHCWIFQICWHIECSTLTASSFRIWNMENPTGNPSPPLALFVVMLCKAHLTSHSRMSGSRWVISPSWLSSFQQKMTRHTKKWGYDLFKGKKRINRNYPWVRPHGRSPRPNHFKDSQRTKRSWRKIKKSKYEQNGNLRKKKTSNQKETLEVQSTITEMKIH